MSTSAPIFVTSPSRKRIAIIHNGLTSLIAAFLKQRLHRVFCPLQCQGPSSQEDENANQTSLHRQQKTICPELHRHIQMVASKIIANPDIPQLSNANTHVILGNVTARARVVAATVPLDPPICLFCCSSVFPLELNNGHRGRNSLQAYMQTPPIVAVLRFSHTSCSGELVAIDPGTREQPYFLHIVQQCGNGVTCRLLGRAIRSIDRCSLTRETCEAIFRRPQTRGICENRNCSNNNSYRHENSSWAEATDESTLAKLFREH